MPASVTRHRVRHLAGEHLDALLQPFEQPRLRIVARQDAARLQQLARAPRRPPAAAGPSPATAPARRGSRRSDRRSATAAGRLRRGRGGTPSRRSPSDCAERDRRLDALPRSARRRPAARRRVSIRSAICERSLNSACPSDAAARARAPCTMSPPAARTSADVGAVDPRMAARAAAASPRAEMTTAGHPIEFSQCRAGWYASIEPALEHVD